MSVEDLVIVVQKLPRALLMYPPILIVWSKSTFDADLNMLKLIGKTNHSICLTFVRVILLRVFLVNSARFDKFLVMERNLKYELDSFESYCHPPLEVAVLLMSECQVSL